MGVIKVETFDVDVTDTDNQTHTLTNDVGSVSSAFVRRTTSIDKQSGTVGSTLNIAPNDACSAAVLFDTNLLSFKTQNSTAKKVIGEVWRYTGLAGGPDEFIKRSDLVITLPAGVSSGTEILSNISNIDKCIPFWTGSVSTATLLTDYDGATVCVSISDSGGNNELIVERGGTAGELVVYVSVVEFVGSNWTVGHALSDNHDAAAETVDINSAADGNSGVTLDIKSWTNAMIIEASLESDTDETGLSDNLGVWLVTPSTTQVTFSAHADLGARNDGKSYCHILSHASLIIHRDSDINAAEGNGTYEILPFPIESTTKGNLEELSLEWFTDTDGTGTAHARGRVSGIITAIGTIDHWVQRLGNNVRIDWGVAELGAIDGSLNLIADVDSDNIITNNQTNVVITSIDGGFGATQGVGKVELVQFLGYNGLIIQQSIDSWTDTAIQFDVTSGLLANSNCLLYVTTDNGTVDFIEIEVGTAPESYAEAVLSMIYIPDHYWQFQNSYVDSVGFADANGNTSGGTPSFSTDVTLVKGDGFSFEIATENTRISPISQDDINLTAIARRYIGGWIMLDRVSQKLSLIYEEGGFTNNMALLNGFGNNLMFQIADAADDYIQLYVDVPLTPNRPYHFLAKFHSNAHDGGECRAYLDGVEQSRTHGNPWEAADLDAHSGTITFGGDGASLKIGDDRGVDFTTMVFESPVKCNYAHWYSWSNVTLDAVTDIRETLFEKGAPAEATIFTDTKANMQTALDAYANSEFPDWACSIEIQSAEAGDITLAMENITFNNKVSLQIRYLGVDTLTIETKGTTAIDLNKLSTPNGGTINILPYSTISINVVDIADNTPLEGARVYLVAGAGGTLAEGTVIYNNLTDIDGNISTFIPNPSSTPIVGKVRHSSAITKYKSSAILAIVPTSGLYNTVALIGDQ